MPELFPNPFRPGAGHIPPFLAGRGEEEKEFEKLLGQDVILENLILTGLRGVGKTVLLESLKPVAAQNAWGWIGTDLSEAASVSEDTICTRILADLAPFTSNLSIPWDETPIGFRSEQQKKSSPISYNLLRSIFDSTPGLNSDKLKAVLEFVWAKIVANGTKGLVFAYDESQNLHDSADKEQYPLSLVLEVFQSLQRKGIRFMLVLTGLPTLLSLLVESRTYSERMFHQVFLKPLTPEASREAIIRPIKKDGCPITFKEETIQKIVKLTGGYPYFIQFICREVFDVWIGQMSTGKEPSFPNEDFVRKLDSDFFAGRWANLTNRQRDLLIIAAGLPNCDTEFTVQEIVEKSVGGPNPGFSNSHVSQMLSQLQRLGMVFRNRYSKYSFAVPLLSQYIRRQNKS